MMDGWVDRWVDQRDEVIFKSLTYGQICLKEEKSGMTHIQALVLWCVTRKAFPTLCLFCGSKDIYSQ